MKLLKVTLSILLLGVLSLKAQNAEKVSIENLPEISFETEVIDYGIIEHNSNGDREFKFKNSGKQPLIILDCKSTCGCTTPNYTKEPIKRSGTGAIKVHYATDRIGTFEKVITVNTNGKTPVKYIKIKGMVKADPTEATEVK